jgi:hypothetical protein
MSIGKTTMVAAAAAAPWVLANGANADKGTQAVRRKEVAVLVNSLNLRAGSASDCEESSLPLAG